MNARGMVIVSYHSYLIIDLIRYLSLFTVYLLLHYTCTLHIFLSFMNCENSDKIEICSSYFIKTQRIIESQIANRLRSFRR